MTFWEVLFNVIAFAWSPFAIVVIGIILTCVFWTLADEEYIFGSTGLSWTYCIVGIVLVILNVTFLIWAIQAGINPVGWHYPVSGSR